MNRLPKPFQEALPIIETIEKSGHVAYFVGGCIRDLLLNRQIGDMDITTSAKPEVVQAMFNEVIPVGIEHGTVIVRHNDVSYEVTTFRLDGHYSDNRHPDSVQFVNKIDMDLARRDFTINALAMDKHGKIIDLFEGKKDLGKKLIRTVGNGHQRLKEDPLRILRAIRFSSQLGFTLAEETLEAIQDVKEHIEGLAVERITVEIRKLFAGKHVENGLQYVHDLQISPYLPIFKEFQQLNNLLHTIQPVYTLPEIICILHQLEPKLGINYVVKEWKCSNKVLKEATILNQAVEYYRENGKDSWLLYLLLPNFHHAFTRITSILFQHSISVQQLSTPLPIYSKKELAINGHDIVELFPDREKGPWIHELLCRLEKAVILGELKNEKSMLKEWIAWNPPELK